MRLSAIRAAGPGLAVLFMWLSANGLGAQGVTPAATKAVTLEQAVQLTLEHSPSMAQAEGVVRTTTASQRSAYGGMLPSLSLSSGANRGSSTRFNSATNTTVNAASSSYTAGLSASMDVFAGGRHLASVRQANADNAAADASLVQERFAVALAAKTAFFNVLRDGELVRVAQAQLQEAQEGLDAANQRLKVGSATQSDVLRAQLALNQGKQALAQAQTTESSAEFALGRLVGESGPVTATPPASLEPTPLAVTEDQLPALVDAQAPSVVAAQAQVKSGTASVAAARAQYMPTLRLSAGDNWVNDQMALAGGNKSWTFGLGLSFPIFNGFQREQNVELANVAADNARVALDDARLAARATLESDLAGLKLAEQQLQLTREAVTVAQEDLRVQNERYRLGAGTMLDRLTSEAALVDAQAPSVVAAQAQVKSGTASVAAARSQYMPTLRLSAGDNWVNDVAALSGGNKSWSLGLGLSFPIFNGFQREQNVETANVQADNARVALDDARLNTRATLESDLAALQLAEQQVQLTREATAVAQEDMRVQNERYRLGAGTMLDRLTSQAALVQAQTNEVNARYDYQVARATLEALVGRSL